MYYLNKKHVKETVHRQGLQITDEAIAIIDAKIDEYLHRLTHVWNGHHKRITAEVVAMVNVK